MRAVVADAAVVFVTASVAEMPETVVCAPAGEFGAGGIDGEVAQVADALVVPAGGVRPGKGAVVIAEAKEAEGGVAAAA